MTENVQALLDTGVIEERGEGASLSRGGRRPILLSLNSSYAYMVAIDLSFEKPIFILANIGGIILHKFALDFSNDITYERRFDVIKNAITRLLKSHNLMISDIGVICISSPGIYSPSTKLYIASKHFNNWHIDKLHEDLENDLNIKVIISNDVNSAALGEITHGIAQNEKNVLYIGCGVTLGAGIIIEGHLCKGFLCSAGAIANFRLNCTECDDGFENTLENRINIISLLNKFDDSCPQSTKDYFENLNRNVTSCTFDDVVNLYNANDDFTINCLKEFSDILANAIINIMCVLNSKMIIIGGNYCAFASLMVPIISKRIEQVYYYPIDVVGAELGEYSGVYGLFYVARDYIFEKICTAKKENSF